MLTWASCLKRIVLVAGTCALLLCLVGIPAVAAADPLVVWCEPHKVQTMEELARQWAKDTGMAVKVEPVSVLETANKVQLSGPLGKGPDVFCCLSGQLGMLVTTATVAPIDRSSLDLSNFMPVGLEAAGHGGKLYGIPYDVSTVALIYNKDLMPEPPATMNDLISLLNSSR